MAPRKPATDRPRQLPKSRFWPRMFSFVSISALTMAPIAALALWVMISDPVTAAAVMERGDLMPVLSALARIIGKAFASLLAIL